MLVFVVRAGTVAASGPARLSGEVEPHRVVVTGRLPIDDSRQAEVPRALAEPGVVIPGDATGQIFQVAQILGDRAAPGYVCGGAVKKGLGRVNRVGHAEVCGVDRDSPNAAGRVRLAIDVARKHNIHAVGLAGVLLVARQAAQRGSGCDRGAVCVQHDAGRVGANAAQAIAEAVHRAVADTPGRGVEKLGRVLKIAHPLDEIRRVVNRVLIVDRIDRAGARAEGVAQGGQEVCPTAGAYILSPPVLEKPAFIDQGQEPKLPALHVGGRGDRKRIRDQKTGRGRDGDRAGSQQIEPGLKNGNPEDAERTI